MAQPLDELVERVLNNGAAIEPTGPLSDQATGTTESVNTAAPLRASQDPRVVGRVFDITDAATWPVVLTIDHVAAIYQPSVGGIRKALARHRFNPLPFRTRPYLWRRSGVLRDVEGTGMGRTWAGKGGR